jgi:hypothetical protein
MLKPSGIFYCHSIEFVVIWLTFPPVLVLFTPQNLATLANTCHFSFRPSSAAPFVRTSLQLKVFNLQKKVSLFRGFSRQQLGYVAGLPDGLFSNQKSKFGEILEGLAMKDVGIFYKHLVHFTVFRYILLTFGTVRGNLVHFSPVLVFCTKKNLATLLCSLPASSQNRFKT